MNAYKNSCLLPPTLGHEMKLSVIRCYQLPMILVLLSREFFSETCNRQLDLHLGPRGQLMGLSSKVQIGLHHPLPRWWSWVRGIWMFPKIGFFPPKSSIIKGFSIINHPFWGTPIFGNTHMWRDVVLISWSLANKKLPDDLRTSFFFFLLFFFVKRYFLFGQRGSAKNTKVWSVGF